MSSNSSETPTPTHTLKVWPQYFDALDSGGKTFELRKDDRTPRFAVGDVLRLREWDPTTRRCESSMCKHSGCMIPQMCPRETEKGYTGRECMRLVTYATRGGAIPTGFCVMSVVPVASSLASCATGTEDALEPWFGCFSGDCPHETQAECDAAIRKEFARLERVEQRAAEDDEMRAMLLKPSGSLGGPASAARPTETQKWTRDFRCTKCPTEWTAASSTLPCPMCASAGRWIDRVAESMPPDQVTVVGHASVSPVPEEQPPKSKDA